MTGDLGGMGDMGDDDELSPEAEARVFAGSAARLGAWPPLPYVDATQAAQLWNQLLESARAPGPVPYPQTIYARYIEGLFEKLMPTEPMAQLRHHAERATILLRCQRQPPVFPAPPNRTR